MKFQNIFLVGPPGAGKTTIGRVLADELKLDFLDSDEEIEQRAGADVAWIFDVEGENGFRIREERVIEELTQRKGILLSTGGGAILSDKIRKMLAGRGVVVFIDVSIEDQLLRMEKDKRRPLLQTQDKRSVLEDMCQERAPLYDEIADLRVISDSRSVRAVIKEILEKLASDE